MAGRSKDEGRGGRTSSMLNVLSTTRGTGFGAKAGAKIKRNASGETFSPRSFPLASQIPR